MLPFIGKFTRFVERILPERGSPLTRCLDPSALTTPIVAVEAVRRMGYDFYVSAVTIGPPKAGRLPLKVEIVNRGVAPFYYDWPAEFGLIGTDGQLVTTSVGSGKITDLLPGDDPRIWDEALSMDGVPAGKYKVAMRVPNKLATGPPIRFANRTQDADIRGWLTLGEILLKGP